MDWCSIYLTPQGLPKYIYLSPPLVFLTTYNGIRTKKHPVWITPGAAPIRWMGPIRNPRWEHKRNEGYVIVSTSNIVYHVNSTVWKITKEGDIANPSFYYYLSWISSLFNCRDLFDILFFNEMADNLSLGYPNFFY